MDVAVFGFEIASALNGCLVGSVALEKIQQAIERARQQRASSAGDIEGPQTTLRSADRSTSPLGLDLTKVQSVALDPKHLRRHRVVAAALEDPLADIFRSLRTQVQLRLEAIGGRSLSIFSARDGEGKTLVATNLAISLARAADGPIFLIDLDFRRPSVHRTLGLPSGPGLADYIENGQALDSIICNVEGTSLYVLPQPNAVMHGSELIGSNRTRALIQELVAVPGSCVIADCPPLLLTDEPLAVQSFVDSCMLVVEQSRTSRDEVKLAAELLDETKYLGSVLNKAEEVAGTSYYGYR